VQFEDEFFHWITYRSLRQLELEGMGSTPLNRGQEHHR
jgi:hypothetical protein